MNISRRLVQPVNIAHSTWLRSHLYGVILLVLAVANFILYFPSLTAYFISDDFSQLSFLFFNAQAVLSGQEWKEWFLGVLDGYLYFRPATYTLTLVDYLAWGLYPFGFHLTNVILHVLSSFQVFLIAWRLSRNRVTGVLAGAIFAVLPIHAGAVSWMAAITDVLCGLLFLSSLLFFMLYRQKNTIQLYVLALVFFAFALAAKEVAIVLPACILLYDGLFYTGRLSRLSEWIKRHAPFWIVLSLYLGFRLFVLRTFGYRGTQLMAQDVWNWVGGTLLNAFDPFLPELSQAGQLLLVVVLVLVLLVSRSRSVVIFGLLWIPITFLPTINALTAQSDHSFYISSFGVSLALASILSALVSQRRNLLKGLGIAVIVLLIGAYSVVLFSRNQSFHRAGEIAQAIPEQVIAMHPTFPPDARLVFIGVPDKITEGPFVYITGFQAHLSMLYGEAKFQAFKFNKFPMWFDGLDRTYFFEVNHRKVVERTDLVRALQERKRCAEASSPAIRWDFANDSQGWEPWNDLAGFEFRDGALVTESQGNDPYMGSPPMDLPSTAIGDIEITMRVRTDRPTFSGALYWLASDQVDFSPGLRVLFNGQADGEFHTYRVDIAKSGMLLIGDHILQLRLDPVDTRAEIAIRSIQVSARCSTLQEERCVCTH